MTPFDVDALLICLAPELDLCYERFYSYLQDDVTKKRPSVDLVPNLLSPSFAAKLALRQRFTEAAPLIKHRLLFLFADPSNQQPPLVSKYLKADERVVRYLLDQDDIDPRLHPYARHAIPQASLEELLLPEAMKQRLTGLVHTRKQAHGELTLYLQKPYGVGKKNTGAALCHELGLGLLVVGGEKLLHAEDLAFETAVHQDVHQGPRGAQRLLLAQRDRAGEHVRRNSPWRAGIGSRNRAQGIEAAGAVSPEISTQDSGADLGAHRAGNAAALSRDLVPQRFLMAAGRWIVNELGDQAIPK